MLTVALSLVQNRSMSIHTRPQKKLYEKASRAHVDLMREVWPRLVEGTLKGTPQDESKATHWPQRRPEDGPIHASATIEDIDRLVRATTRPYPGAFTIENGKKL